MRIGKHTLLGWSWRILLWVTLTPILLFLLLAILIYIPPVQKFAVDKAAEMLSEELGMEVTVEDVSLKFPLDLSMGGMLAMQDGDTVVYARELDVSVKALPLFKMKAEVDGFHLYDAKINTKDMIDAAVVRGRLAELSVVARDTDLKEQLAVVNKALLRDADFFVSLADSVPEDTTESEKVLWKIRLDDIELQNVKARVLLAPQADSTYVMADIASAHTKGFLDLGEEVYRIDKLDIEKSSAGFDINKADGQQITDNKCLNPNHLLFSDISLSVDSFVYKGTQEMTLNLVHLEGKEQSGLVIAEAKGRVEMDSLTLRVPNFKIQTDDSSFALAYRMDMNAFDEANPGTFSVLAEGMLGKGDLIYFTRMGGEGTRDVCTMMAKMLSAQPIEVQMKADGNMDVLEVSKLYAKVPTIATIEGKATLYDVADDLSLTAKVDARDVHGATVKLDGSFAMANEAYKADVVFNKVVINHYMPLGDRTSFSGRASAQGHGFDFLSPSTALTASANLTEGYFGDINLSGIDADVALKGSKLTLDMVCDNEQLQTDLTFDGELKKNLIAGLLNINLPFVDVQSMGFSEERLQASTSGEMTFSYNLDKLFRVDSHIDALTLWIGNDSITTDDFQLFAEALKDTTSATLKTGDLDFAFFTPNNIFTLIPRMEKIGTEAARHLKERDFNLYILKKYLPELSLHITAGQQNPVATILKTYGITFEEFIANVEASPSLGLTGDGHIYSFMKDSIKVDTAFFDIAQDSLELDYRVGVQCHEQPMLPAFRASLEGYIMPDKADAHLQYFNKANKKGIDLGLNAIASDSCINVSLYPKKPILAFREFTLNPDNYITLRPNSPILADVRFTSTSDSSYIAIYADESSIGTQIATIAANDLNLKELLSVVPIPGLPSMGGMIHLDATYIDQGDNFLVEGELDAERFTYEGSRVGDFGTRFTYTPQGETAHSIDASLSFNGTDIAELKGVYDTEGDDNLDACLTLLDVPMSMVSPFVPDQIVKFSGTLSGDIDVTGPTDALLFNGAIVPKDVHVISNQYSFDLTLANSPINVTNSRIEFDSFQFYGADHNPLTLNGYVDIANFNEIFMSLSLTGREFKAIEAKRSNTSVLFGNMYGDLFLRVIGSTKDLTVRGMVRVLPTTDITYIMSETPLYQGDRLEDIVTFVDFNAPPPKRDDIEKKTFMGIDMNVVLSIEDGAEFHCEFSADKQSYVNVQGGGSITATYTPEGVLSLMGRYTINEGEMKYTLPVIPLKTFTIEPGSYIEFTGTPSNPTLNVAATERTKTSVSQSDGSSRSVAFDVGLRITNTLANMGLEFTIDAPQDIAIQNELASCSPEEKNKLAVAMLATGMYLSGSNSKGFTAGNALNNFLQNEINNIAGKAMSTMVDVNVGMEQTTRDDGTTRTDYSFQFSRRFFSDKLNVIIGGKVSADGNTEQNESGAYIDDVSLEWRLDNGGTQYIRLFHEKDFSNLIEGELDKNGAGILLRRKVDKLSDLLLWRKKKEESNAPANPANVRKEGSDASTRAEKEENEAPANEKNKE